MLALPLDSCRELIEATDGAMEAITGVTEATEVISGERATGVATAAPTDGALAVGDKMRGTTDCNAL